MIGAPILAPIIFSSNFPGTIVTGPASRPKKVLLSFLNELYTDPSISFVPLRVTALIPDPVNPD